MTLSLAAGASGRAAGLEVHPENPRWLTSDGGETALVLSGAHAWSLFQDYDFSPRFDATTYLDELAGQGHNFTRGWFFEDGYYSPLPYAREGGLYRLSPPYERAYVKRLRQRLRAAHRRGLWVSVMLFQGWSMDDRGGLREPGPWPRHPYNRSNTDERVTKQQAALHIGRAQDQQLAYVGYLARKLCSRPNVLWEIANEAVAESLGTANATNWQRNILVRLRGECPSGLTWASCPSITGLSPGRRRDLNAALARLGTDLVSLCDPHGGWVSDPPPADGRQVVVADSDHLGDVTFEWVWKAFLRGRHPVFMDLTQTLGWWNGPSWDPDDHAWTRVRRALGAVQELVTAVNRKSPGRPATGLAALVPQPGAGGAPSATGRPASSPWALFSADRPCARSGAASACRGAIPNGDELLVYAAAAEAVRICELAARQAYRYRWKKARGPGWVGPPRIAETGSRGCLRLKNPAASVAILHLERRTSG